MQKNVEFNQANNIIKAQNSGIRTMENIFFGEKGTAHEKLYKATRK